MSYNYSEFKKKKKDNFNPCVPPDDNRIPSGLIKKIQLNGSEDFIHEYKNINGEICFYIKKEQDRFKIELENLNNEYEKIIDDASNKIEEFINKNNYS